MIRTHPIFVLGLVVFGLHAVFEPKPEAADDPFLVEVSSADIEWFRTMWTKRIGREPTVEELRGQVNQLIREQVLSREAVSIGLDVEDTVVRRNYRHCGTRRNRHGRPGAN